MAADHAPFFLDSSRSFAVKSLASSVSKLDSVKLYEGKNIKELAARGLKLEACCSTLEACRLHLENL
jgi:intracellular sulfur oxidation DsrE/DsrF family protein